MCFFFRLKQGANSIKQLLLCQVPLNVMLDSTQRINVRYLSEISLVHSKLTIDSSLMDAIEAVQYILVVVFVLMLCGDGLIIGVNLFHLSLLFRLQRHWHFAMCRT